MIKETQQKQEQEQEQEQEQSKQFIDSFFTRDFLQTYFNIN